MALPIEIKQLNYVAILVLVSLTILYSGAMYALVTTQITFPEFLGAVGTPTGLLVGWLAKTYSGPTSN